MSSASSGARRSVLALFLLAVMGVGALTVGRLAWFATSSLKPGSKENTVLSVTRGQGPNEIARQLQSLGVIDDPSSFVRLGRVTRQWKHLKAGEYQVSPGMSPMELLSVVTSGISLSYPITVREGENMYEIAADIEAKGLATRARFLELCRDPKLIASLKLEEPAPKTLEGYLYPDTYFLQKTMTAEDIIQLMVRRFLAVWGKAESDSARALNLSRHQILTLASIIEKETGATAERPMISSVFHNRLKKKMRLQSDPTTIYGIWERYKGNIRRSDLLERTPYNTYAIPALPIGPIGNPGKESIRAALNPATTEFLFFVSHNDGTHEFTRTLVEHTQAVKKFQLDPKARQGKSWRDLSRSAGQ